MSAHPHPLKLPNAWDGDSESGILWSDDARNDPQPSSLCIGRPRGCQYSNTGGFASTNPIGVIAHGLPGALRHMLTRPGTFYISLSICRA